MMFDDDKDFSEMGFYERVGVISLACLSTVIASVILAFLIML